MRKTFTFLAGLAVAASLGSGAASAFQESPPAPPPSQATKPPAEGGIAFGTTKPVPSDVGKDTGDKGKGFGFLPKLNFGLELLYGAQGSEQQQGTAPIEPGGNPDELTIKGTFKRRF